MCNFQLYFFHTPPPADTTSTTTVASPTNKTADLSNQQGVQGVHKDNTAAGSSPDTASLIGQPGAHPGAGSSTDSPNTNTEKSTKSIHIDNAKPKQEVPVGSPKPSTGVKKRAVKTKLRSLLPEG